MLQEKDNRHESGEFTMANEIKRTTEYQSGQGALGKKRWFDLRSLLCKVEMQFNEMVNSRGKILGIMTMPTQIPSPCFGNPLYLHDIFNKIPKGLRRRNDV